MDTLIAFAELLLGFVPLVGTVAIIVTLFWAATKLFPKFGAKVDYGFDRLFGVDEDYDEQHMPEFRIHPNNYVRVPR
jgi:hypothetical protein